MLCQTCNENEATIHYFESVNGRSRTLNLCEGCAEKSEMGDLSLTVQVQVPGAEGKQPAAAFNAAAYNGLVAKPEGQTACVGCGQTLEDFEKSNTYQCPACRDTFRVVSGRNSVELTIASQKAELQAKLQQAIRDEKFEIAATLRDQLKELEDV